MVISVKGAYMYIIMVQCVCMGLFIAERFVLKCFHLLIALITSNCDDVPKAASMRTTTAILISEY